MSNPKVAFPGLAEGVTIKVSDSGKCISIYGLYAKDTIPTNFTIEAWDRLQESIHAVAKFVDENRQNILTQDERKHYNKVKRVETKLVEQEQTLKIKRAAVDLMVQNKGMDFDSAMLLAQAEAEAQEKKTA